MRAVIDSDILIDFLQGSPDAKTEILRYDEACFSIISWIEVMSGAKTPAAKQAAEILFTNLRRVDLASEIAHKAVSIRQSTRMKLPDAIILATADTLGCIVVTRNAKDFPPADPRVRIPYQL
ncbi:MAG: PIN domain-containing protein [Verrucomicrobiota bacterium]